MALAYYKYFFNISVHALQCENWYLYISRDYCVIFFCNSFSFFFFINLKHPISFIDKKSALNFYVSYFDRWKNGRPHGRKLLHKILGQGANWLPS